MTQLTSPNYDWLDEAWRISAVITEIPEAPEASPSTVTATAKGDLSTATRHELKSLQEKVAHQFTYRLFVVRKLKIRDLSRGIKSGVVSFVEWTPDEIFHFCQGLLKGGVDFHRVDRMLVEAHVMLSRVLYTGAISKEATRRLPLLIASIGGNFASQTSVAKAVKNRPGADRRSPLTVAVEKAVRATADHSTDSIFYKLKNSTESNSDFNVTHRDGGRYYYRNGDKEGSVTSGRFSALVSAARKAKEKGVRPKRPRK